MSWPEQLSSLEVLWRARHRGDRLPGRDNLRPEDLKPWLGNIALVAVERSARLRFRVTLSGTVLDEYRGYDVTGQYVDVLCGEDYPNVQSMTRCAADRVPVSFIHDNSGNSALYRRLAQLMLPLSSDGVSVDWILVALYPAPANDMKREQLPLAG